MQEGRRGGGGRTTTTASVTTVSATTTTDSTTGATTVAPTTSSIFTDGTSEYAVLAKSLIDSNTCNSIVVDNTTCEENATSYIEVFEYGSYRVIVSSGVPYHDWSTQSTPNDICTRWQYVALPLNPSISSDGPYDSTLGANSWAISGGVFFNYASNNDGDTAWYNEGKTLDTCHGHANQDNEYHYHMTPAGSDCIDGAGDPDQCITVGWHRDGFELKGICGVGGTELLSCYALINSADEGSNFDQYYWNEANYTAGGCHLDIANGYTFDDGYAYVLSNDFPFTPAYFYGAEGLGRQIACSLY